MKILTILLLAASANAEGLERMNMQMRQLPGMQAAPMAGMKRLQVSTTENAAHMKAIQAQAETLSFAIKKSDIATVDTGGKLSRHLLKNGEAGFDLFDQPARCLRRIRQEGKDGIDIIACQQFVEILPAADETIIHAVLRFAVGDITVYQETWTKNGSDTFRIEQYSFLVSPRGELQEAVKTIFAAAEDEIPVAVTPAEEYNVTDPVIRAVYREIAGDVLRTMPTFEI
ncbi:MAG: hypothetical protein COB53_01135 [Elusimicrobia bacterium]|nr:MAG: hypothetical protein COB53_01135 [Elusimicrobiota bacterium]